MLRITIHYKNQPKCVKRANKLPTKASTFRLNACTKTRSYYISRYMDVQEVDYNPR